MPDGEWIAADTVRKLVPPAWALEWYLPWWIGQAFAVDRPVIDELVRSNILGLLSVRLEDDIVDGDIAPVDAPVARRVAMAAYQGALGVYRARLKTDARFWAFLDRSMKAWRAGSNGPDASSRGAPLKIAAYASCLLADRPAAWPALDRCLDHVLAAFVRYDQFCDWEADVGAGRWNAFVCTVTLGEAAGTPPTQPAQDPQRVRTAVRAAMLTTSVVDAWFELIDADATLARTAARDAGVVALAEHVDDWARRTRTQGADIHARYRHAADRATEIMFGAALRPAIQPAPAASTR
jgi:hypothetical protein